MVHVAIRALQFGEVLTAAACAALVAACANSDPIYTGISGGDGGRDGQGGEPVLVGNGAAGGEATGGLDTGGAGGDGGSSAASSDVCGDGTVDATEECDDGNTATTDGCSDLCEVECEPGAFKNPTNDHCYRVFTTTLMRGGARQACLTWGGATGLGDLVSIADAVEQAFVADLVSANSWIGGHDMVTEGTYEWSDGSPWTYEFWAPNEPNDVTVEDCMFMRADGTWDDHDCADTWPAYVCERRAAGVP
jgi:cysteine-rich repeat protein